MKHLLMTVMALLITISISAQNNSKLNKSEKKSEIVFNSQSEKDSKIKELEASYKVNLSDPTFPKADLEKQKIQLAETKKAKIINSSTPK